MRLTPLALVVALVGVTSAGAATTTPGPVVPFPVEYYGYMNIDATYDSNMFYAIRGDPTKDRSLQPLIIWLQGGPGATSLFGDLLENGPTKLELANNSQGYALVPRNHSWTKHATMLYIDNPIGTGFSFTRDPRGFSTTDSGIADNLVAFVRGFMIRHPEFMSRPLWVFCESYGGKMTAYFGAALVKAIKAKTVRANFKGVALGDGWVDPIGCMYSYGKYLYSLSEMSAAEADNVTKYAAYAQDALERGNGTEATNWWGVQQGVISYFTANVNWYNVMTNYDYTADGQLNTYLAGPFTQKLGPLIPPNVSYGGQGNDVFNFMQGSFMFDGVHQVQEMIDAGVSVNVYGGQIDLIVDTICIQKWISKLEWSDLPVFWQQPRIPIYPPVCPNFNCNVKGFVQRYKNFAYWQVMGAGHMVPLDQPWTAETMMKMIIGAEGQEEAPPDTAGSQKLHRRGSSDGHLWMRPASKP